jgi:hypothetical protein
VGRCFRRTPSFIGHSRIDAMLDPLKHAARALEYALR